MYRYLILFFLNVSFVFQSGNSDLEITVNGISESSGTVHIALFQDAESFPEYGRQFKGMVVPAKSGEVKCAFRGIKNGKYAIAVFHDKNRNGKLDRNFLGMPTEKYGFSNNARATFSAPSFSDAAFQLSKNTLLSITIR